MLDANGEEAPAIVPGMAIVPGIDECGRGSGVAIQAVSRRRTRTWPGGSVRESLDRIHTLGLHGFIAEQFSMPEGAGGYVAATVMRLINHLPNKRAIELLGIVERDDVLEIGYGPGWALKKMSALASKGTVTGVDRSPAMFRQARSRNRAEIRDGKLRLIQGSFECLPLESDSVDKILAVNVIYFCSPVESALAEARRVLRGGGTMTIYATDESRMRGLQFIGPETRQTFDRAGLAELVGKSAFASDHIDIEMIRLPFGFRGLVARLRKR